ncbi:MAG: fused MFS/spermidine synthase [Pseudomonadota bacterium]
MTPRHISIFLIFSSLFLIGFALMGYEMLGSRYLNPYFGGGITTWAALISVVLLAMMIGYLTGGYIVDARPSVTLLSIATLLGGLSIIVVPAFVDQSMEYILQTLGDGLIGVLVGATLISFIPVALLSACSPFVVRLLLQDLNTGGKTTGWVYGVSTLGNVLGTLVTTFSLIPSFGTRTITIYFGLILIALAIFIFLLRSRISGGLRN